MTALASGRRPRVVAVRRWVALACVVTAGWAGPAAEAAPIPTGRVIDTNSDGVPEDLVLETALLPCTGAYVAFPERPGLVLLVGTGGAVPTLTGAGDADGDGELEALVPLGGGWADVDLDGDMDVDCSWSGPSLDEVYVGLTCGFTATSDLSGQVVQDPNTQVGETEGGPWAVAGATSVTMTCVISVGDGVIDWGDTTVSQTTPGPVGVLASPVSYQAGPGQDVWLCTQVSWSREDRPGGTWEGVLDDPDGNPYCDLAISVEA